MFTKIETKKSRALAAEEKHLHAARERRTSRRIAGQPPEFSGLAMTTRKAKRKVSLTRRRARGFKPSQITPPKFVVRSTKGKRGALVIRARKLALAREVDAPNQNATAVQLRHFITQSNEDLKRRHDMRYMERTYFHVNEPEAPQDLVNDWVNSKRVHGKDTHTWENPLQRTVYFNTILSLNDIKKALKTVFNTAKEVFKLQMSLGVITEVPTKSDPDKPFHLMTVEQQNEHQLSGLTAYHPGKSARHHYFQTKENGEYIDAPKQISNWSEMKQVIDAVTETSLLEKIKESGSNWRVIGFFSLGITVTRLTRPLGDETVLPKNVKSMKGVYTLEKSGKYNLCVFASIAAGKDENGVQSRKNKKDYIGESKQMYEEFYGVPYTKDFSGVDVKTIKNMEDTFGVCINQFELVSKAPKYINDNDDDDEDNSDIVEGDAKEECEFSFFDNEWDDDTIPKTLQVESLRCSTNDYAKAVNILHFEGHCMAVTNLQKVLREIVCSTCSQIYPDLTALKRHQAGGKCTQGKTKDVFDSVGQAVGGEISYILETYEKMAYEQKMYLELNPDQSPYGLEVLIPPDMWQKEQFAAFDIECCL
jgi:hypothetical protein